MGLTRREQRQQLRDPPSLVVAMDADESLALIS